MVDKSQKCFENPLSQKNLKSITEWAITFQNYGQNSVIAQADAQNLLRAAATY